MNTEVARLIECECEIRRLQAEQLRLIVDLDVDEWTAHEIGPALQLSPSNAEDRVRGARTLDTLYPNVLDAMAAGVISERSAHSIVDPTKDYADELAQRAVSRLWRPPKAAVPNNCVVPARPGCSVPILLCISLVARRPAATAKSCSTTRKTASPPWPASSRWRSPRPCTPKSTGSPSGSRTTTAISTVRADVMAGLILEDPKTAGLKPLIQVTVPITALLGVDERPGQLDAGQLIPAEVVRS